LGGSIAEVYRLIRSKPDLATWVLALHSAPLNLKTNAKVKAEVKTEVEVYRLPITLNCEPGIFEL
jgi:hypothetical protein